RLGRCDGQGGANSAHGIHERIHEARAVVLHADRDSQQRVVTRYRILHDTLAFGCEADARTPDVGEFAVQQNASGERVLIVRVEFLSDGTDVELERLITNQEIGFDILSGEVVTQPGCCPAAEAGYTGGEIELLRI